MTDLLYPIGKFILNGFPDKNERKLMIGSLSDLPEKVKTAAKQLPGEWLEMPYREGDWTARQVIHHLSDSHMNAYIRFKLALTENTLVIRPYNQDEWAKLPDVRLTPVEVSISLLESIHKRWVILLSVMTEDDFKKKYIHPESGEVSLAEVLALYDWHGRHHLAHINSVLKISNH